MEFIFIFQASEILAALAEIFEGYNDEEKAAQLKKVRAASIHPTHPPTIAPLHLDLTVPSESCSRDGLLLS